MTCSVTALFSSSLLPADSKVRLICLAMLNACSCSSDQSLQLIMQEDTSANAPAAGAASSQPAGLPDTPPAEASEQLPVRVNQATGRSPSEHAADVPADAPQLLDEAAAKALKAQQKKARRRARQQRQQQQTLPALTLRMREQLQALLLPLRAWHKQLPPPSRALACLSHLS